MAATIVEDDRPYLASNFLARAAWNPYIYNVFIKPYCDRFPELEHAKEEVLERLARLIERSKKNIESGSVSADLFNSDKTTTVPEMMSKAGQAIMGDDGEEFDEDPYDILLTNFIESIHKVEERFLKNDDTLITEKKCHFLAHLQLISVWDKALSPKEKAEVWKCLKSSWLIAKFLVVFPRKVVEKLQNLIIEAYTNVIVKKMEFEKEKFRRQCKDIWFDLEEKDQLAINAYCMDVIVSDYTPIYYFVPKDWGPKVSLIIKFLKMPQGRKILGQKLTPFLKKVETKMGGQFKTDPKTGDVVYDEGDKKEITPEEKKNNQSKLFEIVIDAFTETMDSNKDLMKSLWDNPEKGIENLFGAIIPFISRIISGGGKKDDKDEDDDDDDEFFKVPPTTSAESTATSSGERKASKKSWASDDY